MTIDVVRVAYGEPAVQLLADRVRVAKAGDPLAPVTVVVPSNYAAVAIRRELARRGGTIGSHFLTLYRVAERLGMSGLELAHMEAILRARQRMYGGFRGASGSAPGGAQQARDAATLADCYAELEIESTLTNQEVTKAYRRQMSRHHPDKLVANGLPESMAQMAKEKTQRIQEAYEGIRAARGMR